jgi:hypothetical protein
VQLAAPWDELVTRCLAQDAKDRFANMAEVRRALERKSFNHRRGLGALLALGLCVGAGAVGFAELRETRSLVRAPVGAETAASAAKPGKRRPSRQAMAPKQAADDEASDAFGEEP